MLDSHKKLSVSVCMATYNGRHYINEQLTSIINELDLDDEIIIIDDKSTDDTLNFIESLQSPLIKIVKLEKNLGHVQAFNAAIMHAKNDIIMLSDQDDIWIKGRKKIILKEFESGEINVLASGFTTIDKNNLPIENPYDEMTTSFNKNNIINILLIFFGKVPYFGCAMAIRNSFAKKITPIPKFVEAHDIWIGLAGNVNSCIHHINEKTLLHRIHGSNATKKNRSVWKKFRSRILMIRCVWSLIKKQ